MAAAAWGNIYILSEGVPLGVLQMACASNGMHLGLIQGDTEKMTVVYIIHSTLLYLL